MPITNLERSEARALVHLRQALEVVMSHDDEVLVSDVVSLIHIIMSDEPLTVRKLGTGLLGRGASAGHRAMNRLQKEYYQNKRRYPGLNLIHRADNAGNFKLTPKGETVIRSFLALLAT